MCVGGGFFFRFRAQIEIIFHEEIIFAESVLILNAGNIAGRFETEIIFRKADFIQLRKVVFGSFSSDCSCCFLNIERKIVVEREIVVVSERRRCFCNRRIVSLRGCRHCVLPSDARGEIAPRIVRISCRHDLRLRRIGFNGCSRLWCGIISRLIELQIIEMQICKLGLVLISSILHRHHVVVDVGLLCRRDMGKPGLVVRHWLRLIAEKEIFQLVLK